MAQKKILGSDWLQKVNDNFDELYLASLTALASDAEAIAKTLTTKAITPKNLAALGSSATFAGLVELATGAETITGTDATRAVTPAGFAEAVVVSAPISGTHAVTAEEATAGSAAIDTGKATATVFVAQVYRAGVMVMGDAVVSLAAGVLTVADGASTYSVTEADVINWIVF